MIQRLRRKFVYVFMSLVAVFLASLLTVVYISARRNMEAVVRETLVRVLNITPGNIGTELGGKGVTLPCFTVEFWGGEPSFAGGTYAYIDDTEVLEAILEECLSREEPEGLLEAYSLRYLRKGGGWHFRIAFVDVSMERTILRNLLASCLLIALTAVLPLLGLSVLLARWAVAPVERAWRQQRQFLSDASHELKTPLTVILSNADLLEAAGLEDRPRRWADNIQSEARRMKALVEEMLTLARADSEAPAPVMEEASLSDAAADCALSFEPVAFEAGKPLRYEIAPDVRVQGDGVKLRRLVSILLDNAIKYGAEGGTITLELKKAGREALLAVSNPGEPIPPEELSRLFERFYRGDASRGEQGGFGLGLSIAATIAREHRGTLRAESDSDSMRFTFTLPLIRQG